MTNRRLNEQGAALTVAIMTVLLLSILGVTVLTLAYNQARLTNAAVGGRTKAFYRAQAGMVDGQEKIHVGSCPACQKVGCASCDSSCPTFGAACPYENPGLDPKAYSLDVDGDKVMDTTVDIGPVDAKTNLRDIVSLGLQN